MVSRREEAPEGSNLRSARTCLASDLVGAEVLAVVEEVAAQRGADAPVVGALELVLLTRGDGGGGRWGVREAKVPVSRRPHRRETNGRRRNSRQLISSEPSPQLLTPSHLLDSGRHTRSFWQRKALVGGHWNLPRGSHGGRREGGIRSGSESERKLGRVLWAALHSLHSSGFSSELSPQSSSPSHFQARGLHRVLLHWNLSTGQ